MSLRTLSVLLVFLAWGALGAAQDAPHGWAQSAWPAAGEEAGARVRAVPAAALALEADESLAPELAPDGLHARFAAVLEIRDAGRYRFGLELEGGSAALELLGADGHSLASLGASAREADAHSSGPAAGVSAASWSEYVELAAGEYALELQFDRAPRGASGGRARLRTLWQLEERGEHGFGAEPIPTRAVHLPAAAIAAVAAGERERDGLALWQRKGCFHCHAAPALGAERDDLAAPRLDRIGERVDAAWIERWILDPAAYKPHADMPDRFGDAPAERAAARALVQLLVQHSFEPAAASGADPAEVARGRDLYHKRGCIACHGARSSPAEANQAEFLPDQVPELDVIASFGDLAAKWRRDGLVEFLLDPLAVRPDGRMPSLALSRSEARAIAAYLVPLEPARAGFAYDTQQAGRGMREWIARGCGSCHALFGAEGALRGPAAQGPAARALAAGRGCLAPELPAAGSGSPRFALRASERAALGSAVALLQQAGAARAPAEETEINWRRLSCGACHARSGAGGVAEELRVYFRSEYEETDLGDEGRLPPDLGQVGFRLHSDWMRGVLVERRRARPYLGARMPDFNPADVARVADGLCRAEGLFAGEDAREPVVSDAAVQTGRQLTGRAQLACISCHLFQDYPPNGTPGPALDGLAERVRYEYFRAYVPDALRYKPGTRMPSFSKGGRSTLAIVHGGDIHAQVDALWCYFNLGAGMPVPPGIERQRGLELVVGERPIVMRCFLADVSPRAIAVGLPNGVSFAFDASSSRFVYAWRGAFLDASGAWAERGGTIADGQGQRVWSAPPGAPVLLASDPDAPGEPLHWQFAGYELDAAGLPSFEARAGALLLRQTPEAQTLPALLIRRQFELRGLAADARVWVLGSEHARLVPEAGVAELLESGGPQAGMRFFGIRAAGAASTRFAIEEQP